MVTLNDYACLRLTMEVIGSMEIPEDGDEAIKLVLLMSATARIALDRTPMLPVGELEKEEEEGEPDGRFA